METILIATDFSAAAHAATVYGFELAKAINAKIILFTSYHIGFTNPEGSVYMTPDDNERRYYRKLLDEVELLDPTRKLTLETECHSGPVTDSISTIAEEKKVSYIIVGMKGHGKEKRKLFGSTVINLYKHSTIPLIVVPEDAIFSIPKAIALASDINDESDVLILEPLKKIAVHFNAKLFISRVIENSMNETVERIVKPERLDNLLKGLDYTYEYSKDDDVVKALNTFAEKHAIDMIAITPHQHTLIERLFTKSVTKDLIFNTSIPLLILPSEPAQEMHAGR